MLTIVKITKCKSGQFENAVSMCKRPKGSVYIGNIVYYLTYLLYPFPRSLVDLERSRILPTITLLMHIDRLGLFYHF